MFSNRLNFKAIDYLRKSVRREATKMLKLFMGLFSIIRSIFEVIQYHGRVLSPICCKRYWIRSSHPPFYGKHFCLLFLYRSHYLFNQRTWSNSLTIHHAHVSKNVKTIKSNLSDNKKHWFFWKPKFLKKSICTRSLTMGIKHLRWFNLWGLP